MQVQNKLIKLDMRTDGEVSKQDGLIKVATSLCGQNKGSIFHEGHNGHLRKGVDLFLLVCWKHWLIDNTIDNTN